MKIEDGVRRECRKFPSALGSAARRIPMPPANRKPAKFKMANLKSRRA